MKKKLFTLVIAFVLLSTLFVSCKSHKTCAAYTKLDKVEAVKL